MYTHKFAAKNPGFNIDDFNEKMRKLTSSVSDLKMTFDDLLPQI